MFILLRYECQTINPTNAYLHSELSLVKAHKHVDDIKPRGRLILLVNPSKQSTQRLVGGREQETRGRKESEREKREEFVCVRACVRAGDTAFKLRVRSEIGH